MDKRTENAIKKIRESRCQYPMLNEETGKMKFCGKKQLMSVSLPVLTQTESGKIEASENIAIPIPFCEYHSFLVMGTGMFGLKTDDKLNIQQLIGPFDVINTIESVVTAMAMTGQIQEIFKSKEEVDKEVRDKEVRKGFGKGGRK